MRKCLVGVNLHAARGEVGAKVPDWSHPLNIVSNLSFPQTPRTSPEKVRSERTCCFFTALVDFHVRLACRGWRRHEGCIKGVPAGLFEESLGPLRIDPGPRPEEFWEF